MSKKNKKDKELDIILEQLKKSYGTESSDEIADNSYDASESEDDLELSAVLSKLFVEESDLSEGIDTLVSEEEVEPEATITEVEADIIAESNEPEEFNQVTIEVETLEDESLEPETIDNNEDITEYYEEENEPDEVIAEDEEIDVAVESDDDSLYGDDFGAPYEDESCIQSEDMESFEDITAVFDETQEPDEDEIDEDQEELSAEELSLDDPEFAVEDEEYDVDVITSSDNKEPEQQIDIEAEEVIEHESDTDEDSAPETTTEPDIPEKLEPVLILDPTLYTSDVLQEQLPKFKRITTPQQSPISSDGIEKSDANEDEKFDDNDISLLLKLGYGDEIKSKVGEKKTRDAVLESNREFAFENNKQPYGFCGEELTNRDQIPNISKKYQSAKNQLIAMLASVSVLFLMLLSITVYFDCYSPRTESFPVLLSIELALVVAVALVLYKKLFTGITGFIKFEPDQYSVLAFIMAIYTLYDVLALIIYMVNHKSMQASDFSLFGACVALYSILTVAADLASCIKEASTFSIIASSDNLYVAEGTDPNYLNLTDNEKTFKIKKASLINGYFKRTAQSKAPAVNFIYVMGVVPLIALIIGCAFAIPTGNLMSGITSATVSVFLCIPLSCICLFAFHENITSVKLANDKLTFVGYDAADEYARAQNVVFKDIDVISITSYSEIQPHSVAGNASLNIAYDIFNALNGTISSSAARSSTDGKSIVINSITDNGIDLTYAVTTNILFGDKSYMKAHNIKVKTDSTLHGATKGSDRSVLYMAFDGVPKLGFILASQVNPKFIKSAHELEACGIKTFVESYEPHVNDVYFAQNIDEKLAIGVFKPKDHEPYVCGDMANGSAVSASGGFHISKIFRLSRQIVRQRNVCKYVNYGLMSAGLVLSCLLALVINSEAQSAILDFIKAHSSLILNVGLLLGLIPTLIALLKFKKEISEPTNITLQNGDKKQK